MLWLEKSVKAVFFAGKRPKQSPLRSTPSGEMLYPLVDAASAKRIGEGRDEFDS